MNTLSFPSTITTTSPAMIRFRFYDSTELNPDAPTSTIILPAPVGLSNNYNVSFDDLEAGLLEIAATEIIDAGSDIAASFSSNDSIEDKLAAGFGAITGAGATLVGSLFANAEFVRRAVGGGKNKRNELVVNKPQNRSFNMRFQLVPSNKEESDVIQAIVNTFKIAMHPPLNKEISKVDGAENEKNKSLFFMNPARVKVDFLFRDSIKGEDGFSTDNVNRKVFSTSFCFISSLDVNYHNAGAPSYFSDGQPGNMAFSVEMREVHPNSREMIKRIDLGTTEKFGNFSDTSNPTQSVINRAPEEFGESLQSVTDFLGVTDNDDVNIDQGIAERLRRERENR